MKVSNLLLFVVIIFIAGLLNWLVFQQFPWQNAPVEDLRKLVTETEAVTGTPHWWLIAQKDELFRILGIFEYLQHVFVYLLAGGASMLVIRHGERKIFARQAATNWKILAMIWVLPVMCLGTSIAENSNSWFDFLVHSNWVVISILGGYSFAYQVARAFGEKIPAMVKKK